MLINIFYIIVYEILEAPKPPAFLRGFIFTLVFEVTVVTGLLITLLVLLLVSLYVLPSLLMLLFVVVVVVLLT